MWKKKIHPVSIVAVAIIVIVTASIGMHELFKSSAQTPNPYPVEQAVAANDFLNSIGVNIHMQYYPTPYGNADKVAGALKTLGIRWVRDNPGGNDPTELAALKKVQATGVKFDFVETTNGIPAKADTGFISFVKANFLGSTEAIEGLNERDNDGNANWASLLCSNQNDLFTTLRHDTSFDNISIYAPALVGFSSGTKAPALKKACPNIAATFDNGTIHSYPGGHAPEAGLPERMSIETNNISGSKQIVATETGYHNALQNTLGHLPASEGAAGVYMPRLYLSYFKAGVKRTSTYELVDQGNDQTNQEKMFGLFHNNWTIKPAGIATANLTSILADSTSKAPGKLAYSLSGADSSVQHVLLQKSDGSFYLALWRNSEVWDPKTEKVINAPTTNIQVNFPAAQQVSRFNILSSAINTAASTTVSSTTSLSVPVGPQVTILRIAPSSAVISPVPTPAPTPAPVPAPGKPDLSVQSISGVSANGSHEGARVTFMATVKNNGTGPTPSGTILGVGFKVDGAAVSWSDSDKTSLAPGATATLTANSGPKGTAYWTATAGKHTVEAYVDDVNRISEANENNNKLSFAFTTYVQPPLTITPGVPTDIKKVEGSDQPIVIQTTVAGSTSKSSVAPHSQPTLTKTLTLVNPVSGAKSTVVYVDGKKVGTVSGNAAKVDTTYWSNGTHVITLSTKLANGSTRYTARAVTINNKLSAYQGVRNFWYRYVVNKIAANVLSVYTFAKVGSKI